MAELIFSTRPGIARIMKLGDGSSPAILSVIGHSSVNLAKQNAVIITGIGVSQDVHAQFVSSLQKLVYIYSFGDKIGNIQVTGVAFDTYCLGTEGAVDLSNFSNRLNPFANRVPLFSNPVGAVTANRMMGPNTVFQYYENNRAIDESKIMKVTIGKHSFQGYLISMNLNTSSPEFRIFGFAFTIATIPHKIGASGATVL